MAAELAGRARPCLDLKRTTYPLFSLVLRTAQVEEIADELRRRFGDDSEFFENDLLVLNVSALRERGVPIDFDALVALLRGYRLQPVGVYGGSPAQMQAANDAGLVQAPEVSAAASMARSARSDDADEVQGVAAASSRASGGAAADAASNVTDEGDDAASSGARGADERLREASERARAVRASASPAPAAETVVVDTPMRSGQRIYAKGADLVVLDVVSFGAEVFADGNIHVYAPLRGRAIAGARGNESARIFTTCLDPQLVAIAGVYKTIDTPLPPNLAGKPAQVRRAGESLIIEPL